VPLIAPENIGGSAPGDSADESALRDCERPFDSLEVGSDRFRHHCRLGHVSKNHLYALQSGESFVSCFPRARAHSGNLIPRF
jgi:hypothetical protein